MQKKSDAYKRHKAALRSARQRQRDKTKMVPSTAQITTALGFAARAWIAERRVAGQMDEAKPMVDAALAKLRGAGHEINSVTISRLLRATSPASPITSS